MHNVMVALPNIGGALCSTPQFGWRPLLEWRAVTLPRREGRWNLQGVPQTGQPISAASRSKFTILWGHVKDILLLNNFFRLSICALIAKISPSKLCDGAQMAIFATFLRPVFSASRVQQVSDLHLKFALRPHHVWKYGRHPICGGWD